MYNLDACNMYLIIKHGLLLNVGFFFIYYLFIDIFGWLDVYLEG